MKPGFRKVTATGHNNRKLGGVDESRSQRTDWLERLRSVISVLLDIGKLIEKGAAYIIAVVALVRPLVA